MIVKLTKKNLNFEYPACRISGIRLFGKAGYPVSGYPAFLVSGTSLPTIYPLRGGGNVNNDDGPCG